MKLHIAFAVILILLLSFIPPSFAEEAAMPDPVARVVWIKGELRAAMANGEMRILQKKSIIYLADTLTTDEKSQAEIVFSDNSLMTLRNSTEFKIKEYAVSKSGQKGSGKFVADVVKGGFRTVTGLIGEKDPENYKINTPVATIGVRGTDYQIAITDGKVFIGYYKGTPCIQNKPKSTDKKTKKETVCLSKDNPYASVDTDGSVPVPLSQRPAEFATDLEIIAATITPFSYGKTSSGVMSSFCIQ